MAYTTSQTVIHWANGEEKAPGYCERRGLGL